MEQRDLTRKDLEAALGSRARVSEILNRRLPLTMKMAWRLHEAFGIPTTSPAEWSGSPAGAAFGPVSALLP